ncbi:sensor histidine kinase, partial [Sulfitobacter sp. HI0129]
ISLSVEPLELHALLDDAIDLNAGYAETLSVDLVKGQFDKDIVIQADEKRMQQVMSNLLSNAAKFSKPGSKVIVSSEIFEDFARILVIDEGIGLSEDHRHKVFDQFSQVDSSDQRAVN